MSSDVRTEPGPRHQESAAKTKGVGFVNVRTFAGERFGANGWGAVLEKLTPEDRTELESVLPVGWYSLALYARLIRAIDEVHGYGDYSLIVQLGRYEAERDLTTIHRIFLRLANPAFVVEKMGEYWRRFHDTGRWELSRQGNAHVEGTLEEWGVADHALCRELVGYMGRSLELVGAKNVLVEHPRCRGRGEDKCFYRVRWGAGVRADAAEGVERKTPQPAAQGARQPSPTPHGAFAASVEMLDSSRRGTGDTGRGTPRTDRTREK